MSDLMSTVFAGLEHQPVLLRAPGKLSGVEEGFLQADPESEAGAWSVINHYLSFRFMRHEVECVLIDDKGLVTITLKSPKLTRGFILPRDVKDKQDLARLWEEAREPGGEGGEASEMSYDPKTYLQEE